MFRSSLAAILFGLAALALFAPQARADKKPVKIIKDWRGSVDNADLAKDAPEYIADTKALEKLWKKWGFEGKVPQIDFEKEIMLVTTTVGSRVNVSATLDDKGNLQVLGMATSDFGTGFRYVLATVSREGVKKVNGKELKSAEKDKE
jgi:hypothetical protein